MSSGDVGCGTFQCFNNNSCEIQGLHHICLTLLHNAGRYDSQVGGGLNLCLHHLCTRPRQFKGAVRLKIDISPIYDPALCGRAVWRRFIIHVIVAMEAYESQGFQHNVSMLLVWCHPGVWKTQRSNLRETEGSSCNVISNATAH